MGQVYYSWVNMNSGLILDVHKNWPIHHALIDAVDGWTVYGRLSDTDVQRGPCLLLCYNAL